MAKVYIITEAEKQSLLKELELEKFKTPDQFAVTTEAKAEQLKWVDSMHRRFHYHVCKALE